MGINTTDPQEYLHVVGNVRAEGTSTYYSNVQSDGFYTFGGNGYLYAASGYTMTVYSGGSPTATFTTDQKTKFEGNMGIGVDPAAAAQGPRLLVQGQNTSSTNDCLVCENSSGTDLLHVQNNGGIKFPTYGAGTLSTSSSGLITASSDSSLKNQITLTIPGLSAVLQLTPRAYSWKEEDEERAAMDPARDPRAELGFFADEVKDIIPEAAPINEATGKYGLFDRGLIAVLTKAIQEQQVVIEDLKARIETLEG